MTSFTNRSIFLNILFVIPSYFLFKYIQWIASPITILLFSLPTGYVPPEAQDGGSIALVEDGDLITIAAKKHVLDLQVSEDELAARRAKWQPPPLKAKRGTLFKYIRAVKSASEGCVTDEA